MSVSPERRETLRRWKTLTRENRKLRGLLRRAQDLDRRLRVERARLEKKPATGPSDVLSRLQSITDPAERTRYYAANRKAITKATKEGA